MNFTGVYIALIIACLYWLFTSKLSDYVLNKNDLDNKCKYANIYDNNMRQIDKVKQAQCDAERATYSKNRSTLMVVMGLLGLFAGIYGANNGGESNFVSTCGLALGGGVVMINFVSENWSTMSDGYRLMLIAGSLGGLVYGGSKMNMKPLY